MRRGKLGIKEQRKEKELSCRQRGKYKDRTNVGTEGKSEEKEEEKGEERRIQEIGRKMEKGEKRGWEWVVCKGQ